MLSAKELLEIRANKSHPKGLPTMPPKEFVPTHSAEETAAINAKFEEKMTYLKEQRAEKKSLLTTAEWLPKDKVARIDQKVGGGWESFGFDKNEKTYLQPEEALFLIELSRLELWYSGTPVSVQQAYQILLKEELCSTLKYRVYSHLCRQGYRLVRRNNPPAISKRSGDSIKVSSPKRAKIEMPVVGSNQAECTHQISNNPEIVKSLFQTPAAEWSDYDCIPNLVPEVDSIQINFPDMQLLPKSIRNVKNSYVISRKHFFVSESNSSESHNIYDESAVASRAMKDFASSGANFSPTNNPLYSGRTKPLLIGNYIGDPQFCNIELYDPMTDEVYQPEDKNDSDLHFCYDVYSPGRHFRKSNPGAPCYILAIANWSSSVPSLSTFERFKRSCGENSIPLIAVAGAGSDVCFYQLKGVVSPLSE